MTYILLSSAANRLSSTLKLSTSNYINDDNNENSIHMHHHYRRSDHQQYSNRQVVTDIHVVSRKDEHLSRKEGSLVIDTEEIPIARPSTVKYTNLLNLTVNESDHDNSQISEHSDISTAELDVGYIGLDISDSSNDEMEVVENKTKRKLRETSISPSTRKRNKKAEIDEGEKKKNYKKKKVSNEEDAKVPPLILFPTGFRKSESFDHPEFLLWLKSNQHLRHLRDDSSKICGLLDKVRIENPGLNEIFLTLVVNGEKVNPQIFDIARLVRPNDSLIFPPKWSNRSDAGATYVWSFDIPIGDLKIYCEEIEKDICENPHQEIDTNDYRVAIAAQFRNYLEKESTLDNRAKVFR